MSKSRSRSAEHDELFRRIALRLGFASHAAFERLPGADDQAASAQDLVESGELDASQVRLVSRFVEAALAEHDGDGLSALDALDPAGEATAAAAPKVFESFGGDPEGLVTEPEGDTAEAAPQFASFGGEPGAEPEAAASAGPADRPSRKRSRSRDQALDGAAEDDLIPLETPGRYGTAREDDDGEPQELGRGGMGRVLVAFDRAVGREVAVKELLLPGGGSVGSSSRSTPIEQRFLREARVTGQLEHPGIVPVHEIGRREDGTLYYAMKIVRGRTLRDALDDCDELDDRLHLLSHFHDLCNAMAYAHSRGVVHRDIKPDNVMVGEFGETVVLDWGLAKARGQADLRAKEIEREARSLQAVGEGKTVDGQVLGTPAYMSPEQADGRIEDIDERSDVWGLGAVLYQILTGRPPYEGVDPYEIVGMVLKDEPVPALERCAEAPADLVAVVDKAMRRAPEDRYADAQALAHEIDAYLHGRRVGAYAYSAWELLKRFVAQNKALSAGIVAVLVTVLVSAVVILFAYDREQQARASAEQKEREATEQRRQAQVNLARAYTNRATELVAAQDYGQAYLYATAALREASRSAQPLPAELKIEMDSALFEARLKRSFELERTIEMPDRQPHRLAFSPDGTKLAVANQEGELSVVTLEPGGATVTRKPGIVIYGLSFSLDGERLLAGRVDGPLLTLDPGDLRQLDSEALRFGGVYDTFALSADQTRAVLLDEQRIAWLVRRGDSPTAVSLGDAQTVAFSPRGDRIVRTTTARTTVLHDGHTGEVLATLPAAATGILAALSADGTRAAAYDGEAVRIIDLDSQTIVQAIATKHIGMAMLAFSPDGQALWVASESGLLTLDTRGAGRNEVIWAGSGVQHFARSRDGSRLATASRGAVRIWAERTGERAWFAPAGAAVIEGSFSPDGALLAYGDEDGRVYLADRRTKEQPVLLGKHGSLVLGVAWSPDGSRVTTIGNDFHLKVFSVPERVELRSLRLRGFKPPHAYLSALTLSPDGKRLAVTGPDGRIQLLHPESLEIERFVDSRLTFNPTALRFSPQGDRLCAAARLGTVSCFATDSWVPLYLIKSGHEGVIADLVFCPDGGAFYTAGQDGWIKRFSVETGTLEQQWRAHDSWANGLVLSPDGGLLLSTGDDRRTKLWDPVTAKLVAELPLATMGAIAAFSPDGRWFTSGNHDGVELLPDPRTLSVGDPEQLVTEAARTTGYQLAGQDGAATTEQVATGDGTVAAPSSSATAVSSAQPAPLAAGEVRGRLVPSWALAGKVIPAGTTVELLDADSERPFSPPLTTQVPPDGEVSFLLPAGVKRFAARTTLGGAVTYQHSAAFVATTADALFLSVPPVAARHNAKLVGLELDETRGWIWAWVLWGRIGEHGKSVPVGCAEVTADTGAQAYFDSPAAQLDPRLDRSHPKSGGVQVYDLEPGVRELSARVGEHVTTTKVRVRAGTAAINALWFDRDQFADNPTPPHCFAEGSPEDVRWRGAQPAPTP